MKLIIDISEEDVKWANDYFHPMLRSNNINCENLATIIVNGTPFDSVIEDIKAEILDEMILPMADVGLRVALEIIDKHIGKAESEDT